MNLRQEKRRLARVFAHEIFQARSRLGWTQQKTADTVFVSLRWYQKIEAGRVVPSFLVGICLMKLFDIEPERLVGEVQLDVSVSAH